MENENEKRRVGGDYRFLPFNAGMKNGFWKMSFVESGSQTPKMPKLEVQNARIQRPNTP